MITVNKPDPLVREQRIETLRTALTLANMHAQDWSQVHRFERAMIDVVSNAVLPRTEEALVEAAEVIDTHA